MKTKEDFMRIATIELDAIKKIDLEDKDTTFKRLDEMERYKREIQQCIQGLRIMLNSHIELGSLKNDEAEIQDSISLLEKKYIG